MNDYTEVEIVRFYNACAEQERDHLRTLALAGRVSQADKQHWQEFIRSLDRSVEPVDKPASKAPDMTTDKGLGDFFNQVFVLTDPGAVQRATDKARKLKKPRPSSLQDISGDMPSLPPTAPEG